LRQLEAGPFFQHSQQHTQSTQVETGGRTLRGAVSRGADQGLHLNEEGADTFDGGGYGHSAQPCMVLRQQEFGGIEHFPQAGLAHFIDADFSRAAKAVLDGAHHAVKVLLVAFKEQDSVYDVFQYLGAGQVAFLVDMADEDDGRTAFLGVP